MKRTIEINYGTSITVNRGNYENFKPMWHQKTTLEFNGETPEQIELAEKEEFLRLKSRLDQFAEAEWSKQKQENSGLRIRVKDGKKYPSVTSVLHPEPLNIDPEYAIRGTAVHDVINHYIMTDEWSTPSPELKKLKYEDIQYKKFFETFGKRFDFLNCKLNIEVFHDKHLYSGEIDCIALVDGIPTLIDFKTGSWNWQQLIAYYKASNNVKQLAIFDLKKTSLEILKLNDPKCQELWETFLIKRGEFKSRFGL